MPATPHQVVIVGGGFGGLYCAQHLKRVPVEVTLLDRRNFTLFQPLLYQVATGALSPANIAAPLRSILRRQKNTRVLLAEVTDIDVSGRRVLAHWGDVPYDTLIIATGARHQYFGHDKEWEPLAPGLKSIEDATDIRARIFSAFEAAETERDPARLRAWLTFVVVGGGPTGVELAGSIGELTRTTLKRDFRNIDTSMAQILLVEGTDRVLGTFPPKLSEKAKKQLQRLGVTVRTGAMVTDIQPGSVTLKVGDQTEHIPSRTMLWAAGVQASPLGKVLERTAGAALDRAGRVLVQPDLTVAGHPEIFVIGDLATCTHQTGKPLPGVAPVAMQEGKYVARLIQARLKGQNLPPFHYVDKGNLATIGRNAAVADLHWIWLSGFFAFATWALVHILYLLFFENRLLVMMQWFWLWLRSSRSARLITGEHPELHPGAKRPEMPSDGVATSSAACPPAEPAAQPRP